MEQICRKSPCLKFPLIHCDANTSFLRSKLYKVDVIHDGANGDALFVTVLSIHQGVRNIENTVDHLEHFYSFKFEGVTGTGGVMTPDWWCDTPMRGELTGMCMPNILVIMEKKWKNKVQGNLTSVQNDKYGPNLIILYLNYFLTFKSRTFTFL